MREPARRAVARPLRAETAMGNDRELRGCSKCGFNTTGSVLPFSVSGMLRRGVTETTIREG